MWHPQQYDRSQHGGAAAHSVHAVLQGAGRHCIRCSDLAPSFRGGGGGPGRGWHKASLGIRLFAFGGPEGGGGGSVGRGALLIFWILLSPGLSVRGRGWGEVGKGCQAPKLEGLCHVESWG